jgi:hypothetical protein
MSLRKIDRSKARLDRSVRRGFSGFILCNYCNERLAELRLIPDNVPTEPPFREVLIPETMVAGKDGVFRVIGHSWQGRPRIRRFYRNTEWLRTISKREYTQLKLKRAPFLPAKLECPKCGELQILDPEILGIPPDDLPPIKLPMSREELEEFYKDLLKLLRDHMVEKGVDEETLGRECKRLMAEFEREDREAVWDVIRGELLVIRDNNA